MSNVAKRWVTIAVAGVLLVGLGGIVANADQPDDSSLPNCELNAETGEMTCFTEKPEMPQPSFGAVATIGDDQHCYVDIDSSETACFDTDAQMRAAVREATGKPLVNPQSDAVTRAPATYAIAVFYDGNSYSGSSLTVVASYPDCYGRSQGGNFDVWNDRISSYRSYGGGCMTTLYEHVNYAGSLNGPAVNAANLGVMNNQASSWRVGA